MSMPRLAESWLLATRADGAPPGTVRAYRTGLVSWCDFLEDTLIVEATRNGHARLWLGEIQETYKNSTVRQRLKIVKMFYRWLIEEGEMTGPSPFENIKGPAEAIPITRTLTEAEIKLLLATCQGNGFRDRRDLAILMLLLDTGMRRAECVSTLVEDIDIRQATVHIVGKGARRRGAKHRVVGIGTRTCQAVDRYLRVRDRHQYAALPELWLSPYGALGYQGIRRVVEGHGVKAGLVLHAHMLRHTFASEFRRAGGNEGDLMVLGGWSTRQMLDRYGKHTAEDRAREAGRRLSLGDRLR